MRTKSISLYRIALWAVFLFCLCTLATISEAAVKIEKVAESSHQWTGVTVTENGRIFVNFPTWNNYPQDYRVAELKDGREVPYPCKAWNEEFVCVQSVVGDNAGHLWILDPAKLKGQDVAATGARLYDVELASNEVKRIYKAIVPALSIDKASSWPFNEAGDMRSRLL